MCEIINLVLKFIAVDFSWIQIKFRAPDLKSTSTSPTYVFKCESVLRLFKPKVLKLWYQTGYLLFEQ